MGYGKLFGSTPGIEGFTMMLTNIGVPAPEFFAYLTGIIEFFGGIALLIGFTTRIAAALLAINMLVFAFLNKTKMKQNFIGGYEFNIVLAAAFTTLFLLGAGNLSVDALFGWLLG